MNSIRLSSTLRLRPKGARRRQGRPFDELRAGNFEYAYEYDSKLRHNQSA
jgi:hypothetical protein